MLVGEAPGEQEDRLGRPFIGPTRRFFDQLLQDFGLSRELLFVTSSVKCRPPSNRDPLDDELATCRANWLDPQIRAVDPAVIVLLGLAAVRSLLGPSGKLRELHGTRHRYDGRELLVSYHPTAGMRFPRVRRAMYEDFALLRNSLSED
jgi:DNA polymerase